MRMPRTRVYPCFQSHITMEGWRWEYAGAIAQWNQPLSALSFVTDSFSFLVSVQ